MDSAETVGLELEWENPEASSIFDDHVTYTATPTRKQLGELLNVLDALGADPDLIPTALTARQYCAAFHFPGCTCAGRRTA